MRLSIARPIHWALLFCQVRRQLGLADNLLFQRNSKKMVCKCFLSVSETHICVPAVAQAEKEKAVQNKAYTEAVRSHQRQEEILGFRKIPVQPEPQGLSYQILLSFGSQFIMIMKIMPVPAQNLRMTMRRRQRLQWYFLFVFYILTDLSDLQCLTVFHYFYATSHQDYCSQRTQTCPSCRER